MSDQDIREGVRVFCKKASDLNEEICNLLNIDGERRMKIDRKYKILRQMLKLYAKARKIDPSSLTFDEKYYIKQALDTFIMPNLKLAKDCKTDASLTKSKISRENIE